MTNKLYTIGTTEWIEQYRLIYDQRSDIHCLLAGLSTTVQLGINQPQERICEIEILDGKCIYAGKVRTDNPEFKITAPANIWKKIAEARLGVKAALISRQLEFTGPLTVAFKYMRGLSETLKLSGEIPTDLET